MCGRLPQYFTVFGVFSFLLCCNKYCPAIIPYIITVFWLKCMLVCMYIQVPLNDLLTKCCIEVESPLMAAAAVSAVEDGSGSKPAVPSMKKSKTIGGTIRIIIKVRSPLLGPQKVLTLLDLFSSTASSLI